MILIIVNSLTILKGEITLTLNSKINLFCMIINLLAFAISKDTNYLIILWLILLVHRFEEFLEIYLNKEE